MKKLKLLIMSGILSLSAQAGATVIYSNDFNSGSGSIGSEWSGASWHGAHDIVGAHIGDYSLSGGTTLTLTGLASHTSLALSFDLYLFNTWDGNNLTYGPDYFSLSGDVTFSHTFTNHQPQGQTYPGSADVNPGLPGASVTQIYYGLDPTGSGSEFLMSHTGSSFTVTFSGPTSQTDEQWGIDNVKVSIFNPTTTVPEPATVILMGLGLLAISLGLRRKT